MNRITKKNQVSGQYERAETALPFQVLQRLGEYEDAGMTPQQVERMRWISVDERLPEIITHCNFSETVLVAMKSCNSYIVRFMSYNKDIGWCVCGVKLTGTVTHWMPTPEPPEENES